MKIFVLHVYIVCAKIHDKKLVAGAIHEMLFLFMLCLLIFVVGNNCTHILIMELSQLTVFNFCTAFELANTFGVAPHRW